MEAVIERGLQTFIEVGAAIGTIRDRRLYRTTHDTFEAYCRERWGWSASRARQLIGASEVATKLETVTIVTPANEAQARELARVPEEKRPQVWEEAVSAASSNGSGAPKPTAAQVRAAAERHIAPPPDAETATIVTLDADDHAPDPIAEWERAEREVSRLTDLVAAMESDDKDRELRKLSARCAGLEGRLHQVIESKNQAVRSAKYAQGILRKIRTELEVESDREIVEAIRDLKR